MRTVEETIEVIRPALQADGGDIILRDVDEGTGVITVTLVGACGTCPASTQTLKAGIERICATGSAVSRKSSASERPHERQVEGSASPVRRRGEW